MEDNKELEEGEIEEDVFSSYTPLERPLNITNDTSRFPQNIKYSDSEDSEHFPQSSDSESSDFEQASGVSRMKKRKIIKCLPKQLDQNALNMPKKYDIWCTRVQDDVLSESIINCDVTLKDRSRNVESYDTQFVKRHFQENGACGTKRTRKDRKNKNFKRPNSKKTDDMSNIDISGESREIPDLQVDNTCSDEEIAKDIANKLCECRDDLIIRVINILGKEKAIELFNETKCIEADGGLLVMNMTRRRTPGGVFLYLVRRDCGADRRRIIFQEDRQQKEEIKKKKKKLKTEQLKKQISIERNKLLPELLTRAQLLAKQKALNSSGTDGLLKPNSNHETNCKNPPPSPATDHHESCDDVEMTCKNENTSSTYRDSLKTYDEDFLDLGCDTNIDLF